MSSVVVKLQNASIYQSKNLILPNVSFELSQGEFVYLVGKVGTGKSSLIKTLNAEIPLRLGEGLACGYLLHKLKENEIPFLRRKIGVVFQDFQLLIDRSVLENLLFVLEATGWSNRSKRQDRAYQVLEKVGMKSRAFKMPHQLSGGEQQRVVIARALLNDPVLILADEPTGNLDPATSEGILELLLSIKESGSSILMATHNYSIIDKYPHRLIRCSQSGITDISANEIQNYDNKNL